MNIFDVGRIYFTYDNVGSAKRSNKKIDNLFAGSYLLGVINFLLKFVYFFLFGNKKFPTKRNCKTKVLFYGISRNNRVTLEPIIRVMDGENIVSFVQQKVFPSWKLYWHAFPHLFELVKEIRHADEKQKKILKLFFPKFWRMYGCPPVINEMLDIYKPEVVVMANDHQEFNRCLLLICKERGIKTIYVQHASAGTKFPPLQFTYSLLDGKDAYNKYKAIGNMEGNVYLLGGVRFDVIKSEYYNKPRNSVIGVAINLVDDEKKVKKTCEEIKKMRGRDGEPVELIFRPHPQMDGSKWKSWCDESGIIFSSPKDESSFEFIGKTSLVVANQCSIHLDTAMCHKLSVIFNMSDNEDEDVYLFKKNGLANECTNVAEIKSVLDETFGQMVNRDAVQYYNYSFGTPYEGKVAKIIGDLINSILANDVDGFNKRQGMALLEETGDCRVYMHQ